MGGCSVDGVEPQAPGEKPWALRVAVGEPQAGVPKVGGRLGWGGQWGRPTGLPLPPVWEEVYLPKSLGLWGPPPTWGKQCGGREGRKADPPN